MRMNEVVIDSNVLMVANGNHNDASLECVAACVNHLQQAKQQLVIVVDDDYRILREYQTTLDARRGKQVGVVFLKWLLQQVSNPRRVNTVRLTENMPDCFEEFPDAALEPQFDPADRKFAAVANAHPAKPPIWQAVDSKWLDWWRSLAAVDVQVEFLCPSDVCAFYRHKFPTKPVPSLPG